MNAHEELQNVGHYNMRWLKPLDTELVRDVAQRYDIIVTVEDGMSSGGLGSAVLETMEDLPVRVKRLGVHDRFVTHGSTKELMHMFGLDADGIADTLINIQTSAMLG